MTEQQAQTAVEEEYIPSFIGHEFEQWWAKRHRGLPDRSIWGAELRARYEDAEAAWLYAYQRGLDVNY